MRVSWFRCGVAVVAVGCALPSVSEYAGGAPEAQPSLDGGLAEASADAGVDAPSTTDGAFPPPHCTDRTGVLFCADFDRDPYDDGFIPGVSAAATIGPSTVFSVSAPRSLVASLPARGNTKAEAHIDHQVNGAPSSFRLAWSTRVVSEGAQTAVDIGGFYKSGAPFYSLSVRYRSDASAETLSLFEYADAAGGNPQLVVFTPIAKKLGVGRVSRVELRVTSSASASSVTVLVDDVEGVTAAPLSAHKFAGPLNVMAGIGNSDGAGAPITVYVDDLVLSPL